MLSASAILQSGTLTVTGTNSDDTIVVAPAATAGQVDVNINNVDFGDFTATKAVVYGLAGSDELAVSGIAATVYGGSGDNRLVGPNVENQLWLITGADAGSVGSVQFSQIERLKGGSLDDTFRFMPGGSISGRIEGNDGRDTLDYSQLSGPITVNNTAKTASLIGGTYLGIETLIGSASTSDLLIDNGLIVLRYGPNSGAANYAGAYLTFYGMENVASGAANTFEFFSDGSLSGTLSGVNSTLNYKYFLPGVNVNLTTGAASGVAGGVTGVVNVLGTSGNDTLIGNSLDNYLFGDDGNDLLDGRGGDDTLDGGSGQDIVLGGDGNDNLQGGTGRDIVIGGNGSDVLMGGTADDVLVAGEAFAYDPALNANAYANLMLIRDEWVRSDLGYKERVYDLQNGGGLNGANVLNNTTVANDGASDTLTGNENLDWFLVSAGDTVTDANTPSPEIITTI
jgi:Ca2+-binding RTX toxin-like protein